MKDAKLSDLCANIYTLSDNPEKVNKLKQAVTDLFRKNEINAIEEFNVLQKQYDAVFKKENSSTLAAQTTVESSNQPTTFGTAPSKETSVPQHISFKDNLLLKAQSEKNKKIITDTEKALKEYNSRFKGKAGFFTNQSGGSKELVKSLNNALNMSGDAEIAKEIKNSLNSLGSKTGKSFKAILEKWGLFPKVDKLETTNRKDMLRNDK